MPRIRKRIVRRRRPSIWPVAGLSAAVLSLAILAVWTLRSPASLPNLAAVTPVASASAEPAKASVHQQSLSDPHPLYPFSVIAGGAHSPAELRNAVGADQVVAAHYAVFHLDRVRVIQLTAPRMAYVSYRRGNKIFWTRHKMALPAGETLLTDGEYFARTRCGNRLAETPQTPVSKEEPQQRALDRPAEPFPPVRVDDPATLNSVDVAGLVPPAAPPPFLLGPPSGSFPGLPGGPIFLPPIPGGPTPGSNPGGSGNPGGPDPVSTPEPSSLLLAVVGALAFFAVRARVQAQNRVS